MRIVVTGSSGFVGSALLSELRRQMPTAVVLGSANQGFRSFDLLNAESVENFIISSQPDLVIHLAAQSNVAQSFLQPERTFEINFTGTLRLLEALKKLKKETHFFYISTGEVYGASMLRDVATEETLLQPMNPYAVSKAAADLLVSQYASSDQIRTLRIRPFNHIGPGQSTNFVIASFARQLVLIEKGLQPPTLRVGNLAVERDFSDVRDVVSAYLLLIDKKDELQNGDIYNVCSSKPAAVASVLEEMREMVSVRTEIQVDSALFRPVDIPKIQASNRKIMSLGWRPSIRLEKSLEDIINYYRKAEL